MDKTLQELIAEWDWASGSEEREKLRIVLEAISLKLKQLTTAPAISTARTVEGHWDADKMVYSYTTPTTPPSSPSDRHDMASGPAAQSSGFAHCGKPMIAEMGWEYDQPHLLVVTCQMCGASWRLGRIVAQGVDRISSISARGASSRFVENSAEESVQSPSNEYPNEDQLKWLDKGGEIALTTLKEFIEGRLKINRNDFKE